MVLNESLDRISMGFCLGGGLGSITVVPRWRPFRPVWFRLPTHLPQHHYPGPEDT